MLSGTKLVLTSAFANFVRNRFLIVVLINAFVNRNTVLCKVAEGEFQEIDMHFKLEKKETNVPSEWTSNYEIVACVGCSRPSLWAMKSCVKIFV